MAKTKAVSDQSDRFHGWRIDCPACGVTHILKGGVEGWQFNGNLKRPTFTPSLLVYEYKHENGTVYQPRCHSFITDGSIAYLGDCTHGMAGQTVELPEIEGTLKIK